MKKGIIIGLVIVIVAIVLLLIFLPPKNSSTTTPETVSRTNGNNTENGVVTYTDAGQFVPHFIHCEAGNLKMLFPSNDGNTFFYIIKVAGIQNGNCNFVAYVSDAQGNKLPPGMPGPQGANCSIPIDKFSENTVKHMFGGDENDTVREEQTRLQQQYCVQE